MRLSGPGPAQRRHHDALTRPALAGDVPTTEPSGLGDPDRNQSPGELAWLSPAGTSATSGDPDRNAQRMPVRLAGVGSGCA